MAYIKLKNFNSNNQKNTYFVVLNNKTYIFLVRWSEYCKCAFLSIRDDENNDIVSGKALVNGLVIRNNKLPYVLYFFQIDGKNYEPNLDIIADEFVLYFDSEELIA